MRETDLLRRVLTRLEQAEVCELDPHFRADLRVAWITVLNLWRGESDPHVFATYAVLGMHPDRVWSSIVANRKAQLGSEYSAWYDDQGNLRAEAPAWTLAPRKPVQSERRLRRKRGDTAV